MTLTFVFLLLASAASQESLREAMSDGLLVRPPDLALFEPEPEQDKDAPADKTNEANNPLTPKLTLNLHDYYAPDLIGVPDREANQLLFRGLMPHKLGGLPQLFRFTVPLATAPEFPSGSVTGLGDLTLMDLFVIPAKPFEFGVGPLFVAPLSDDPSLSSRKYQLGAAGIAILPQAWGIAGGLLTYQHSVSGSDRRDDVSLLTFQPLLIYNLPEGFYVRSTGVWTFDLEHHHYYFPAGIGAGKVWALSEKVTMNTFVEPQYSVAHDDYVGAPRLQIFFGVNFQIALR
jgi:hypothetical protein